jgi:hypothetical protein
LIGRGAILQLSLPGNGERQLGWPVLRAALGAASGWASSPSAQVLVRPEHVHRGTDGIPMRVISSVFEGERFALELMLSDGQRLKAYSGGAIAEGALVPFIISGAWRL